MNKYSANPPPRPRYTLLYQKKKKRKKYKYSANAFGVPYDSYLTLIAGFLYVGFWFNSKRNSDISKCASLYLYPPMLLNSVSITVTLCFIYLFFCDKNHQSGGIRTYVRKFLNELVFFWVEQMWRLWFDETPTLREGSCVLNVELCLCWYRRYCDPKNMIGLPLF